MSKILGYGFLCTGLLAFFFFLKYQGTAIPLKELWFVLSLFIIFVGVWFLARSKFQRYVAIPNHSLPQFENLKQTGEKIKVTLENAEVKSRSYYHEKINDGLPSRTEMMDALYDDNRNFKTEFIQQTYIVFYKNYHGKTFRFVSLPTQLNAEAVKNLLEHQDGIHLYVDPNNPTNYYFDLPQT